MNTELLEIKSVEGITCSLHRMDISVTVEIVRYVDWENENNLCSAEYTAKCKETGASGEGASPNDALLALKDAIRRNFAENNKSLFSPDCRHAGDD